MPTPTKIEQLIREDFQRLWATNFLDDLSIEAHDYVFANGVVGKIVVFNMEERQRIRIVDYEGLTKVDQSAIEETLKEKGLAVRLDSFLDPGTLKRVASVVRELYAEKGYQYAEVTPEVKAVEGAPSSSTSPSTSSKGRRSRYATSSSSAIATCPTMCWRRC